METKGLFLIIFLFVFTLFTSLSTAKPSPGCGKAPQIVTGSTPASSPLTISSNNKNREYFVSLPPNYNSSTPHRLILTLHALGGAAVQVVQGTNSYLQFYGLPDAMVAASSSSNVTATASQIPTVFLAPNGLNRGWSNTNLEDVNFLRTLITALQADLCIDTSLVFSTGFSFGGAMSYMLACNLGPAYIRGVAVLSGNPDISGRCPAVPADSSPVRDGIAVYIQHGVNDNVLPISGGRAMRDRFARVNGCDVVGTVLASEPAVGSGKKRVKTEYKGCAVGKPVVWTVFDGPHTPVPADPGESKSFSPVETWEFFARFEGGL